MYNQMLVSGQTRKKGPKQPTIVAPPAHLALILTLTVHPHRTTRLKEKEEIDIVSSAWTYLNNLLDIAGPLNANFKTAFDHVERRARHGAHSGDDDHIIEDRIHSKYADVDSLFHCAPDFWAAVGWAFNCSTIHPQRWKFWKLWLDFMIKVIEVDWTHRQYLDNQSTPDASGNPCLSHLRDSLLMTYIKSTGSGRYRTNHIIKALFADGRQTSRRLFREIFRNEVKELTESDQATKFGAVNLDKDEYGGYMNFTDSEEGEADDKTPRATPKTPRSPRTLLTSDVPTGMAEAVKLRLRLLDIVMIAAEVLPEDMVGFHKLTQELSRQMKEEPINVFQLYLGELRRQVDDGYPRDVAVAVFSELFNELLPAAYEDPAKYMDGSTDGIALTAKTLTHCYLPWPAATNDLDDNARVALLHEAALLLVDPEELASADGLRAAAEKGIQARKAKTATNQTERKKRGKKAAESQPSKRDLYLKETIELSGERMLVYIDCLHEGVGGEENEDDDDTLYCTCRKPESGQMIACENPDCSSGRWFHYECVGITSPPRGKWWCTECRGNLST